MKLLVIGLDGESWDILTDDVLENHMPNLLNIKRSGTSGPLTSTLPNIITAAAWPTAISGVLPHHHGLPHFYRYSFEKNKIYHTSAAMLKTPNMFHYFSEKNLRVAMINVPLTFPVYPVNGYLVAGMGCPGVASEFVYPQEFKQELLETIPEYTIRPHVDASTRFHLRLGSSQQEFDEAMKKNEELLEQRWAAAELINRRSPMDAMMVQFQQTDFIMHHCWHYIDPDTRDDYPWFRDRVFALYEKLDALIGNLVALLDHDSLTVVISDHGFGSSPYTVGPNRMLMDWGYMCPSGPFGRAIRRTRSNFSSLQKRKSDISVSQRFPINWRKTRAAVLLRPYYGALYFNVKGRQPGGCVKVDEIPALTRELKNKFLSVKHPETDENVFESVTTPKECFGEESLEELFGDLILIANSKYYFSSSCKKTRAAIGHSDRSGIQCSRHYLEGMFAVQGSNIKANHTCSAHIADIAPTIYSWLNMDIPSEVDGNTIESAFIAPPRIRKNRQPQYPGIFQQGQIDGGISKEEEKKLAEHLEGLGYL